MGESSRMVLGRRAATVGLAGAGAVAITIYVIVLGRALRALDKNPTRSDAMGYTTADSPSRQGRAPTMTAAESVEPASSPGGKLKAGAETKPRPLWARVARALLGAALLLGPLVATELALQDQIRWLRPVLRRYTVVMDLKVLFVRHREGCPDLVNLGTSLADHALPPRYLKGRKLGGVKIRDPFDFAAAELRATNVLAQYRWLRQQGCKPRWITVEVSPIMINAEHGGPLHDPQFMSARAQLGMPAGWAELRDYDFARRLELATYERLLIHRRREEIRARARTHYELESWALSEEEWTKAETKALRNRKKYAKYLEPDRKLELDGKVTGIGEGMDERKWQAEARKRERFFDSGKYRYVANRTEKDALVSLGREAAAEGVIVIFQAPPTSSLYHEMEPKLGMDEDYAAMAGELDALADELDNVVWIDMHRDPSYEKADFRDWVHLSKRGCKRYVKTLTREVSKALDAERGGS